MARTESLSGTPDPLALPELVGRLQQRIETLEAGLGGGFLIGPDENADDVLNIETNDGAKLQIFPPLVTPQMLADIWEAITPQTVEFDLARGKASVTRVGKRVWLVGQAIPINAEGWHNGQNTIGEIPEGYRPGAWQSFAVSNEAAYTTNPRATRMDVNTAGRITIYSIPALEVDANRVPVTVNIPGQDTNAGGAHIHNYTGGGATTTGKGGTGNTGNQSQNHTHVTDGKTSSGANQGHNHTGPSHDHSVPAHSHDVTATGSDHVHWLPPQSVVTGNTYDQGASLVPNKARYPNWVQLVGTWLLPTGNDDTGTAH